MPIWSRSTIRPFHAVAVAAIAAATIAAPLNLAGAAPRSNTAPIVTAPAAPLEFTSVGVVSAAAAQPTAAGQRISTLEVFEGRVVAGFGDWVANTGPIAVSSAPVGGAGFTEDFVVDTEAVNVIRPIGGKLVIPAIDPRSGTADFATSGPWAQAAPLAATHVFDTATLTGTDLWMVGSENYNAVAWRSTDGGTTWAKSLVLPSDASKGTMRFHFAAVLNGKLYVQAFNSMSGAARGSKVFDGTAWGNGPALVENYEPGHRPRSVGGRLVYASADSGVASNLRSFSGRRPVVELSSVLDVTDDGTKAYALKSDGTVLVSAQSGTWTPIGTAPAGATSLAVSNGNLFVGAANATVWTANIAA